MDSNLNDPTLAITVVLSVRDYRNVVRVREGLYFHDTLSEGDLLVFERIATAFEEELNKRLVEEGETKREIEKFLKETPTPQLITDKENT